MDSNQAGVTVGVFNDRHSAEQAVKDLESHGFTQDQIGYAAKHLESSPTGSTLEDEATTATAATAADTTDTSDTPVSSEEHRGGTREGLVMGGITGVAFGSIVGAAAALILPGIGPVIAGGILGAALAGAAAGAATGGIAGALLHWGFSEEEAEYYRGQFEVGRILVTVHAGGRQQEAEQILNQHGAYNLNTRPAPGEANADTPASAGLPPSSAPAASTPAAPPPDRTDKER